MTRFAIPRTVRNLPPGAQSVLFYCLLNCTEDKPHVVPGGIAGIADALLMDRSDLWRHFDEIESLKPRPVKRIGNTRARQVVVVLPSAGRENGCAICGEPVGMFPGSVGLCPKHHQTHGRADRAWKERAVEIWERAAAEGLDGMPIAYRAHVATNQPLWGRSEEGEPGTGSGSGEGIIPFYVRLGLFPEEMLKLARRARSGGGGIEE